jgi:hypothetical protein
MVSSENGLTPYDRMRELLEELNDGVPVRY